MDEPEQEEGVEPNVAPPLGKVNRKKNTAYLIMVRRVCRLYNSGTTMLEIARKVQKDVKTVYRMVQSPEGEEYFLFLNKGVEDKLLELEQMALEVKKRVLEEGLLGDLDMLKLADASATDILNRAGKRGKPTDTSESKTLTLTGDAAAVAIANALRDPGVRAVIEADPALRDRLLTKGTNEQSVGSGKDSAADSESGKQGPT